MTPAPKAARRRRRLARLAEDGTRAHGGGRGLRERARRRGHLDRRGRVAGPRLGDRRREGRRPALALSDQTTTAALEIDAFLGDVPPRAAQLHADRAFEDPAAFLERTTGSGNLRTRHRRRHPRQASLHLPSGASPNARLIRSLGLDGRARLKGEGALPVATTWSALGNSHVRRLVKATVVQTVTIRPNGSAAVDAEVLFDNGAGTDPPSVLLGRPVGGLPIGTFAADVTLYLPKPRTRSRPRPVARARSGSGGPRTHHGDGLDRGPRRWVDIAHRGLCRARRRSNGERREGGHPPRGATTTMAGIRYEIRVSLPDGSTIVSASAAMESARRRRGVLRRARRTAADLDLRFGLGQS